jgi:hypothetical protein
VDACADMNDELYNNRWSDGQRERCNHVELIEPAGKTDESPVLFELSCE